MFRVRWQRSALDELTDLWTQSNQALRQLVTAASHQVELQLRADPFKDSESRAEGRRVRFVQPLGIEFRVEADGRTVSVLRVWLYRVRGQ